MLGGEASAMNKTGFHFTPPSVANSPWRFSAVVVHDLLVTKHIRGMF